MPVSFSFILLSSPSGSGGGSVLPVFPVGGVELACNAVMLDQQHFLDLYDRIFPLEYISPLVTNPNAGYELLQAFAKIGERVSQAIERFECGQFIIFASGGQKAIVNVAFTRTNAVGDVTVKAGTVIKTSRHNRRFVMLDDVTLEDGDFGPYVGRAEAEAFGYEYNVQGLVVTSSGISLQGEIDKVEKWLLDPPYGNATIVVRQDAFPSTEGKAAELDGLGSNRGMERASGEGDPNYRLRLRSLPDVVSPGAIRRAVERRLAAARKPLPYDFCETFEHRYQECYDAPSPNAGTPSYQATPPLNPDYNNTTFVYDDPRAVTAVTDFCRNRMLDEIEYRGAFVVVVPNNVTLIDLGMAYDDPGMFPSSFLDSATGARRGTPAFDIPRGSDDNISIMTAAYDGFDIERASIYAGLYAELQRIKPAGVAAIIETIRP